MRYEAFMSTDEFLYSGESSEISNKMLKFITAISDETESGTFEIKEEVVGGIPLYYASVCFPDWAEALFLIQFYEYDWELMEESE